MPPSPQACVWIVIVFVSWVRCMVASYVGRILRRAVHAQSIQAHGGIRLANLARLDSPSMKLSGIDLNVLVALDALLSEQSVTRAAVRIGRSQPATSHALNRARELFRDPLLVRAGGGLELTARAKMVAPKIHRLLRELGAVLDVHQELDPAALDSVTIGATDYVGFVLLP